MSIMVSGLSSLTISRIDHGYGTVAGHRNRIVLHRDVADHGPVAVIGGEIEVRLSVLQDERPAVFCAEVDPLWCCIPDLELRGVKCGCIRAVNRAEPEPLRKADKDCHNTVALLVYGPWDDLHLRGHGAYGHGQ